MLQPLGLLILCFAAFVLAKFENDIVKSLPGLNFETKFKTYSGYLNANEEGTWKMHYVLTESKSDPEKDPLLVWFNGGPRCSSLIGLFDELGPFYINRHGKTLFENPYSWNERANVLFLESPIGAGFSYSTVDDYFTEASDNLTADQNYRSLDDFFRRVQPKYGNHSFFLSGESYAGVYIPMLSQRLVEGINNGSFANKKFKGAAIGNGMLHRTHNDNAMIVHQAYNGFIPREDWNLMKKNCRTGNETDVERYNFQRFKNMHGYKLTKEERSCAEMVRQYSEWTWDNGYNYYQECYQLRKGDLKYEEAGSSNKSPNNFNYRSTDSHGGYPCWNDQAVIEYLNRKDVQAALNIDEQWKQRRHGTNKWKMCNYELNYNKTQLTTNQNFEYVFRNSKDDFRFLIYSGDADLVCPYLGNYWFLRDIAEKNRLDTKSREAWYFASQQVGFNQNFYKRNAHRKAISIDLLTVKGAGHFVPLDRPGPALQMINNFLSPRSSYYEIDYSESGGISNIPIFSKPLVKNARSLGAVNTLISLIYIFFFSFTFGY